ncbi:MAG: amidohydrolase family protein [Lachnospiraceae bacterium]
MQKQTNNENGMQVPYSSGRAYPDITIPENACDCHHHIFDPVKFPYVPTDIRNQPPATVEAYKMLQKKLGLTRNVIVTPSAYGTDNSCTLDALKQMGSNARAVVVIDNDITDKELQSMDASGVKGIRFNITRGQDSNLDNIRLLAERIADYNWHICFWMNADLTVEMESFLWELPCQIVFDHRGHLPAADGVNHPAFEVISKMMTQQKAWVKISALYHDSQCENYEDTIAVGKAYVAQAPDQVIWGTDWPHPSEFSAKKDMPDDAHILDLLAKQATAEEIQKILIENPARLFGF